MDWPPTNEQKATTWKLALSSLPMSMWPSGQRAEVVIGGLPGKTNLKEEQAYTKSESKLSRADIDLKSHVAVLDDVKETSMTGLSNKMSLGFAGRVSDSRYASEPCSSQGHGPLAGSKRYSSMDTTIEIIATGHRRRRISSGGEFTLINLASNIQEEDLTRSFESHCIFPEAITDIRIRRNPFTTSATVRVAAGYSAIDIERRVRGLPPISSFAILEPESPKPRIPPYNVCGTDRPQPGVKSNMLVHDKLEPETIDLTAEESDAELGTVATSFLQDEAFSMESVDDPTAQTESVGHLLRAQLDPISPTLSYLTIDAIGGDEVEAGRTEDEVQASKSESTVDDEQGSPSSSDDEDHELVIAPAITLHKEDDLMQLLYAPIEQVKRYIQGAPDTQRHEYRRLSREGRPFGHAYGKSRNRFEEDSSDSESTSSSDDTNSVGSTRQSRRSAIDRDVSSGSPRVSASVTATGDDGSQTFSVCIPRADYVRARRLLVPGDATIPITTVGMRGDLQFIDQAERRHIAHFSLPADKYKLGTSSASNRNVVDAHLLDESTIVIGYDHGPNQVSCVVLDAPPRQIDIEHRGHTTVIERKNGGPAAPNPGVAAMSAMAHEHYRRFLTGGRDGAVRMWTASWQGRSLQAASVHLSLSPERPVTCLAYRKMDDCVFMCHQRHIYSARVEDTKASEPNLLSAVPRQVHVHPQDPNVVILEVDHLDRQMQVYDLRHSNFDRPAIMEFGYRDAKRPSSSFRKGSTSHALFARGYEDGTIALWDYRKSTNVVSKMRAREDPIVHAVLSNNQLLAYGSYRVTFWNIDGF